MTKGNISQKEIISALRVLIESGLIRVTNEFDESLRRCSVESLTDALTYYKTVRGLAKSYIPREVERYDKKVEDLLKNFRGNKK